jgi:hypothetical protein
LALDATEVIDSYVHDVAKRLPPGRRGDVAFELRVLLTDDLRARAELEGRSPDQEMAVAMLREFGRPASVAVRYYRPFTIVEPSDTWAFMVAAVAGTPLVGMLASIGHTSAPSSTLTPRTSVAVAAWFGVLVMVFGLKNLILRNRSDAFAWKPRPLRDTDSVNRTAAVGLALGWLALLVCYLIPGQVASLLSGGRIAADTLAYSASFTSALRMPWLAGALAIAAGLQATVALQGRWRPVTRWLRLAVIAQVSVQLGWHASYGSILQDPHAERLVVLAFSLLAAMSLVWGGILLYRECNRVRLVVPR